MTANDFIDMGKMILKTEHEFNLAAGFTSVDDRLPEFFEEEIPPHNATWDFEGEEIDKIWNF
jgi:aldehyde:ferredoxin oxidoreductase